jgi:hypothetical protein
VSCLGVAVELTLVKSNASLQQLSRVRGLAQFPFQVFYTFAEGKAQRKLNPADEISAAPTAMAIEQILAGVDIKGRFRFAVERAESNELLLLTSTAGAPLPSPQVVQQRELLFEVFQILIHHGALLVEIVRTG